MVIKIALISDTHIGITKEKRIKNLLKELAKEEFDLLVHAGDYCGGIVGYRSVRTTVKWIREVFPDKPMVSVIGNHDFWHAGKRQKGEMEYTFGKRYDKPSLHMFRTNLDNIAQVFKDNNAHFLDNDGIYVHPDFPDVKIMGHSGWYSNPNPPTNDCKYLPIGIEGDTNHYLFKRAVSTVTNQMDELEKDYKRERDTVVFVSHFPVIKAGQDYKGAHEDYSWCAGVENVMQERFDCKHFLCGHAHQFHNGPLRYEAGSDYCNPKYLIVEV